MVNKRTAKSEKKLHPSKITAYTVIRSIVIPLINYTLFAPAVISPTGTAIISVTYPRGAVHNLERPPWRVTMCVNIIMILVIFISLNSSSHQE